MNNLYLFTGDNDYALRKKCQFWVREFQIKHGQENYARLSAANLSLTTLLDEVSIVPFIAKKRLCMVDGIPKFSTEDIQTLCEHIHPDIVLVFIVPQLDKRLASTKELLSCAIVEEFPMLSPVQINIWIDEYLSSKNARIELEAKKKLIGIVGVDQNALSCELEKLVLYAQEKPITSQDVSTLVVYQHEEKVWGLLHTLEKGDVAGAMHYVQNLYKQGESPQTLWNIILWMLTALTQVASVSLNGTVRLGDVAKESGINIMSVRSLAPVARRLGMKGVISIVHKAADADVQLKTGGYRVTAEAPQELEAIIDRMLIDCCMTARV